MVHVSILRAPKDAPRDALALQLGRWVLVVSPEGSFPFVSLQEPGEEMLPKTHLSVEAVNKAVRAVDLALLKMRDFIPGANVAGAIVVPNNSIVSHGSVFHVSHGRVGWSRIRQAPMKATRVPTAKDLAPFSRVAQTLVRARDALDTLRKNEYPLPNKMFYKNTHGSWRNMRGRLNTRIPFPKVPVEPPSMVPIRVKANAHVAAENLALGKKLGSGTYGTVFKTTIVDTHQRFVEGLLHKVPRVPAIPPRGHVVAVKVQVVETDFDLQMAIQESTLQHKLQKNGGVPAVYASGYNPNNRTYITFMELVKGEVLGSWLEDHGNELPLSLFREIEDAVARMWVSGIAHVDLNPNNIMLRKTPDRHGKRAVIIDFGLSVLLPPTLVPPTLAVALSRDYQDGLMVALDNLYRNHKMERGASDPHVLRWLFSMVPKRADDPAGNPRPRTTRKPKLTPGKPKPKSDTRLKKMLLRLFKRRSTRNSV